MEQPSASTSASTSESASTSVQPEQAGNESMNHEQGSSLEPLAGTKRSSEAAVEENKVPNKKRESSSRDVDAPDTKPFGGRILTDESAIFEQNAWDHAPWGEEQEQHARKEIARQNQDPVPKELVEKYHAEASENWNKFYSKNENRFFKDRHWLRIEFPELFQMVEADAGEKNVMEIGCGAGNTMFPMLNESKNPKLFVYACDFSKTAVEVVKSNPAYDPKRGKAFVWDLAGDDIPPEVEPESMDVLVLIFVLSALHPDKWENAMNNLYKLLKPGGLIVFRDYGRYDMAQLRFKKNRLLSENFYVRGDGTRVYFFDSEEIVKLFGKRFTIEQNAVDRRLLVNRLKKVKMYRVWLQGKFRKPLAGESPAEPAATTLKTTEAVSSGGDMDEKHQQQQQQREKEKEVLTLDSSLSLDTPADSPFGSAVETVVTTTLLDTKPEEAEASQ
ncbi:hypothetical protein BGZ94_009226 [Podila epigama]|nr:hypothetical protein BGZ94_009226 [Podila epigama]